MIRLTTLILFICLFAFSCSQEPVVSQESSGEEQEQVEVFNFEQVRDDGKVYSSDDFFNAGFNEYKEYNVSKLTVIVKYSSIEKLRFVLFFLDKYLKKE